MLPVNTFLICLHKKTVASGAIFYNSEIDRSIDNVYNTIYICTRREDSPHNANYVTKGDRRHTNAVFAKSGMIKTADKPLFGRIGFCRCVRPSGVMGCASETFEYAPAP